DHQIASSSRCRLILSSPRFSDSSEAGIGHGHWLACRGVRGAVAANGSVPVHVFTSHSSKDKPAVEALAGALRDRGIDPWLDKWEIGAGDDIVASINAGLDQAGAGIIVFSRHSKESRWVEAEVSYLTYARIQEQKVLIPVMLGEDCFV